MNTFDNADTLLTQQLGSDVVMALATRTQDGVNVRNVDGYYKNGRIYVVTYEGSHKMQEIKADRQVAVCKDLMCAQGIGANLGNPRLAHNKALRDELKDVFAAFYDRHVNEDDPLTCILEIQLTSGVAFSKDTKYMIDFINKTATSTPFVNDIV